MKNHFLSITDLSREEILSLIQNAIDLKNSDMILTSSLLNKTIVMFFEKPSLRTRLSFEIGIKQLGGHAVYLDNQGVGFGRRESILDIAKVISRMGDIVLARVSSHKTLQKYAECSQIPVINGLSSLEHPCQILADLLTIYERKGRLCDLKIAYIGDGDNNVTNSLCLACAMFGIDLAIASPPGYKTQKKILKKAKQIYSDFRIYQTKTPKEALENADIVVTDSWISMGREGEKEKRLTDFQNYQVTDKLMRLAKSDAILMHCMPVHRGQEVSQEVIDGPQSVIYHQAENRLHVQKALLLYILNTIQQ